MIPKAIVRQWSAKAPWILEAQIEQDLVLCRILVEIFSDPFLANTLSFRGGTALHKLFLENPARYSEDIDLVMIQPGPIGKMLDRIREKVDPWLGAPKRVRSENRVKMIYRFETEAEPRVNMRVKIEINTTENFSFLDFHQKEFAVHNPWFSGEALITTYQLEELMGTKLRALYQRKKGRDLFDLGLVLEIYPELRTKEVLRCFMAYLEKERNCISRSEYEGNLIQKMSDPLFLNDLPALLPINVREKHNIHAHYQLVQDKLVRFLPGKSRDKRSAHPM